jgi:hypothetical protein
MSFLKMLDNVLNEGEINKILISFTVYGTQCEEQFAVIFFISMVSAWCPELVRMHI